MPNRFIWLKDPGMTVARDYLDFGWEQTSAEIVSASVQSDKSQLNILVGCQICPIDIVHEALRLLRSG
jgi:hypothetical protein